MLLRHAKSSWSQPSLADFDRPLNERGLNAAPFMGELMASRELVPELLVSSPARRAAHTAELVRESSGANIELKFDDRIYEASPYGLMQVIADLPDTFSTVMLVGHNPGFEGMIRLLTSEDESMPTAALAVIDIDTEKWADVAPKTGSLMEVVRPREEMGRKAAPR